MNFMFFKHTFKQIKKISLLAWVLVSDGATFIMDEDFPTERAVSFRRDLGSVRLFSSQPEKSDMSP